MAILLEARIVAAALQLVGAVQLDGGIVVTLHGDGGFARIDWAVTAAIPLLLAADVDLQVVEGDVHVALGGVDGDDVLWHVNHRHNRHASSRNKIDYKTVRFKNEQKQNDKQ